VMQVHLMKVSMLRSTSPTTRDSKWFVWSNHTLLNRTVEEQSHGGQGIS
jgi:hypothetical protein